jgi:hypothetical protein
VSLTWDIFFSLPNTILGESYSTRVVKLYPTIKYLIEYQLMLIKYQIMLIVDTLQHIKFFSTFPR